MYKKSYDHYLEEELYELIQNDPSIFDFLQSGSLDGIWYWDLENSDQEWMSSRFWEVFGYHPDEKKHLSSEWQEMIDPDDLELTLENFKAHVQDPNHSYDQIVRYKHKDGSTVWVRCRGLVIHDETGNPIRMLGAHTDVTLLKQAEELISSIFKSGPYALLAVNDKGILKITNPEAEKLFGAKPGALIDLPIQSLLLLPPQRWTPHLMEKGVEMQAFKLDGKMIPVEVSSRPIESQKELSELYAVLDLTEKKAKERKIIKAREEADRANHAKGMFLANMSHELRTPLNSIIGFAELLHTRIQEQGDMNMAEDAKRISVAGQNLLIMINEVLDLSKIEAGHMELHLEEFSLRAFMDDLVYMISDMVNKNGNKLVLELQPDIGVVYTDQTRLRQILLNLLSNAAKFTKDGIITLEARSERDSLIFGVHDTGIGMTKDEQKGIFDEYVQADASIAQRFGGTGLGLSLCRRFSDLLGGRIWLESDKGKGSSFFVHLKRVLATPKPV
jgi:PAS domain S-box-containing protein